MKSQLKQRKKKNKGHARAETCVVVVACFASHHSGNPSREFCGSDLARRVWEGHTIFAENPTRRLIVVGVRPGSTMHCADESNISGAETSEVPSEFEDSGEEDAEVPIVEEAPVRPSVRVQRAGFELLDQWICQSFRTGPL